MFRKIATNTIQRSRRIVMPSRLLSWKPVKPLITPIVPTAIDVVRKNRNISAFVNKTYVYTGGSITASLIGMQLMAPVAVSYPMETICCGFALGLCGSIAIGTTQYSKKENEKVGHYTVNSSSRLASSAPSYSV